ncbi:Uncharacterised protein [Mycobacteroides abscessus]|nr:Uncharacterised protein [Mycobacteroides abscessus]
MRPSAHAARYASSAAPSAHASSGTTSRSDRCAAPGWWNRTSAWNSRQASSER